MKILFCQLRTHGDIIRTFPIIDLIRRYYPDALLAATGYDFMSSTWRLNSSIDYFLPQPVLKCGGDARFNPLIDCSPLQSAALIARETSYNIYIDFQGALQSAMFGSICQIPQRIGHMAPVAKDGAHLFYTDTSQYADKSINRMQRHLILAKTVFPYLEPAYKKCTPAGRDILIIPGSSRIGSLKRWPFDFYCRLAVNLLSTSKNKIFMVFGPEDDGLKSLAESLPEDIVRFTVNSFEDYLNKLFPNCFCVIGNDSAPLHLAIWQRIPVFMLFGPTSACINGPWIYAQGAYVKGEHCSNCDIWRGKCGNRHSCMRQLSVSYVVERVNNFLDALACRSNRGCLQDECFI